MLIRPPECRGCPLDTIASGFSMPEGSGTLGVFIFGEALGEHEARDGKPFRPYAQAGSLFERVIRMCGFDRQQFRIYNIVNCFSGDTILTASDIRNAYRRWYSGQMVTLETTNGVLTGTPNHPALTLRGWVPLNEIIEGDYLVNGSFCQRTAFSNPYIDAMPARAFKLFHTLAQLGVSERVTRTNVDFHGERPDADVDVVSLDSLLGRYFQATLSQHDPDLMLETSDHGVRVLTHRSAGNCPLATFSDAPLTASRRAVGSACNTLSIPDTHASHAKGLPFVDITEFNTVFQQYLAQSFSVRAEVLRQLLNAFSFDVHFEKVRKVSQHGFSGHVYNLHTQSELYTANGYIVHNCRPPRDFLDGAPWELGAVNHCAVHRERAIQEARPQVILALGGVPLRVLTGHAGKSRGVTYLRGYVLPSLDWGGIPVISSFHPSFIKRGKQAYINILAHDIRKAVAMAQNKFTDYCLNPEVDASNFVSYITKASIADLRSYYNRAKENLGACMAFDIETNNSMFVDEDSDEDVELEIQAGQITQIQFSLGPCEAIAVPWVEPFRSVAVEMLQLPHMKAAHNGWRFDLPVLKRERVNVAGVVHDTRWMWHHLQPDLPAHLQCVGSFYGMPFPWKHLAAYDEEFYGCADADAVSRIMAKLPQQLESKNIWQGYARQIKGLEPILINMTKRGIPVDNEIRLQFDERLQQEQETVRVAAQQYWPAELVKYHPPKGYVRPPADKYYHDHKDGEPCTGLCGPLVQRDFTALLANENQGKMFGDQPIIRWCRAIPFNPGSSDQIIEYLKHRSIDVPKKRKSSDETVGEIELLQLIGRLQREPKKNNRGNDVALLKARLEYVELQKMRGTYVQGWIPDASGFVHPSFNYGTAVGQLASKNPNGQNFPKRSKLAKEMRRMIRAKPGYKIVEIDYSGFHSVTLAFEAQSKNWMRLARSDIHSFTTAHFLHLPERDQLLEWPDDQLRDYLAWVKKTHRETRDNKAKHAILGVGNGLGYRKLYHQYSDYFTGEKEAKTLLDTIRGIFPEVFIYQNRRRREAHDQTYLISKWGYIRWFFDVMHYDSKLQDMVPGDDSEAALCFHHVNDAFGHKKEQMLWLQYAGHDYAEKWQYFNDIHDSFMFHCPDAYVDECIYTCYDQMTKRSPVLIDTVTSPDGLWVDVEASVGDDWQSLEKVNAGQPAGLRPGPDGKAVLAVVPDMFEPMGLPELPVYANIPDEDIPF